jgi:hypothetical protein
MQLRFYVICNVEAVLCNYMYYSNEHCFEPLSQAGDGGGVGVLVDRFMGNKLFLRLKNLKDQNRRQVETDHFNNLSILFHLFEYYSCTKK